MLSSSKIGMGVGGTYSYALGFLQITLVKGITESAAPSPQGLPEMISLSQVSHRPVYGDSQRAR